MQVPCHLQIFEEEAHTNSHSEPKKIEVRNLLILMTKKIEVRNAYIYIYIFMHLVDGL